MRWVTFIEAGPIDLVRRELEDRVRSNPALGTPGVILVDMIRTETGDMMRVRIRADVAESIDRRTAEPPRSDVTSTFEMWSDAYEEVWHRPERLSEVSCPECGHRRLCLRFVSFLGLPSSVIPTFWCDACRTGFAPTRGVLPDWASPVSWDDADIPDYRMVPP